MQMWYNNTGNEKCFRLTAADTTASNSSGDYSFQRCAELGGPYSQGGSKDAFIPHIDMTEKKLTAQCMQKYGRDARIGTGAVEFGRSVRDTVASMSNIIWSNGEFDPWAEYGVKCDSKGLRCPMSVFSPYIQGGAHSSDLMFSHPLDSQNVIDVRRMETAHISSWIEAKVLRYSGIEPQTPNLPDTNALNVVLAN
jgi:hypothetical protein